MGFFSQIPLLIQIKAVYLYQINETILFISFRNIQQAKTDCIDY